MTIIHFIPIDYPPTSIQVLETPTPLASSQWSHLVGTWDHGTSTAYQDGAQFAQKQIATSELRGIGPYYDIGLYVSGAVPNCPTNCYGLGSTPHIDDVRIYNRALTADEVAQIHRMNTSSIVDTSGFRTSTP